MFDHFTQERGPVDLKASAGKRVAVPLINDVRTTDVTATLSAKVTIGTAAATKLLNRGRPSAMLTEVGILEAGKPTWQLDPRVLAHATEQLAPSALTVAPVSATAVGSYNITERLRFGFAHPFAVDPRETWYTERRPDLQLAAFFTLDNVAAALARIIKPAGTTVLTLDSFSVSVQQRFSADDKKLPIFRTEVEEIIQNVDAANPKLEIPLKISDRLRAITITQDTDEGEVTDIISTVGLRGDQNRWLEDVPWDAFAEAQEFESGGDVYGSSKGAHAYINFQKYGRLTNVLNPVLQDTNLRLVLGVAKSATGAVSRVRVTLWKLVRDGYKGPDGRLVVDPDVAFNLY